jgi:hypothetical protein
MASFYVYDLTLLVLFSLFVFFFIKSRRKNVQRQGIIFMYRTQVGVKVINWASQRFKKILHPLKYVIVFLGFILMGGMIWMLWRAVSIYMFVPGITEVIKAPPIAPLIPYFPELFGLRSFFPSFYFTYFIIALAIVAVVHEFSHGIYMRLFKMKIKSTGVVFLGPILGAFVEEEKKGFDKKRNLEQMSVLGAGVFANVVTALFFLILLVGVYNFGFFQNGYAFNTYASGYVSIKNIDSYGGTLNLNVLLLGEQRVLNLTEISFNNTKYFVHTESLLSEGKESNRSLLAFYDAPAIRNGLVGGIIQADGVKISNAEDFAEILREKSPGDKIEFLIDIRGGREKVNIILAEHPENSSMAFLGVSYILLDIKDDSSFAKKVQSSFGINYLKFREPNIRGNGYYLPSFNGGFIIFVYDLIWWVILINFLVALFNMLPLGILDGGKFFYLGVLSVTRSEKFAKWAYKFATYAILLAFVFMMIIYFLRII